MNRRHYPEVLPGDDVSLLDSKLPRLTANPIRFRPSDPIRLGDDQALRQRLDCALATLEKL